jgi:dienelactone hydrolase
MRPDADRWRARGWKTVNLTYRACGQTASDVLWFYDKARTASGAAKICAFGTSAGGNLALLVGAYRPDLYCAVSQAGPTDLRTTQDEVAYDAASGLHNQTLGGRRVHNLGTAAFGEENLFWFSPAALAYGSLKITRVLQGFSADDPLVPYQQTADLAKAMRAENPVAYVDRIQLAAGTIPFAHGRITQDAPTAAILEAHPHARAGAISTRFTESREVVFACRRAPTGSAPPRRHADRANGSCRYQRPWTTVPLCSVPTFTRPLQSMKAGRSCQVSIACRQCSATPAGVS